MTKVLYFMAADVATTAEAAEILQLNKLLGLGVEVGVRNGAANATYNNQIEPCDYVAGTVPTAYAAKPVLGTFTEDTPLCLAHFLDDPTVAVSATLSVGLVVIRGTDLFNLTAKSVRLVDTTYASDDEAVATVDANGVVTGVAAGTCNITCTHNYDNSEVDAVVSTIVPFTVTA